MEKGKGVAMIRSGLGRLVLASFLGTIFVLGGFAKASARVDVNVNIGFPPPFVISAPPPVVVIPGTYVYAIPGIEVDILFYHGYWYRPYEGRWHRARSYNGPWVYCAPASVPRPLIELPPGHYRVPPGHSHIPYGQLKKNWGKWEREQHWASDRDWREGHRGNFAGRDEDRGRGPEDRGRGPEDRNGKGHGGHGKGH